MYVATLTCGTVLSYECRSFLPLDGERVPCRRHGYCDVVAAGRGPGRSGRAARRPRARPRAQSELAEFLRDRPVTSVHALIRERFTLRMLAAAEGEGLVTVDLEAGRVWAR